MEQFRNDVLIDGKESRGKRCTLAASIDVGSTELGRVFQLDRMKKQWNVLQDAIVIPRVVDGLNDCHVPSGDHGNGHPTGSSIGMGLEDVHGGVGNDRARPRPEWFLHRGNRVIQRGLALLPYGLLIPNQNNHHQSRE